MKQFFIYSTLLSAFSAFSASSEVTEHSPLLSRKKPHAIDPKIVLKEIQSIADRMYGDGKKLEELKGNFSSQEAFAITKAYIASACPREALLTLYAEYLEHEVNKGYTHIIHELLFSADKCARCQ